MVVGFVPAYAGLSATRLNSSWNCLKLSTKVGGGGMIASSREEEELCAADVASWSVSVSVSTPIS